MQFSHPLARAAKLWSGKSVDGSEQPVLVVVTTLELDAQKKKFRENLFAALSHAVQDYLQHSQVATRYILINRLRDW